MEPKLNILEQEPQKEFKVVDQNGVENEVQIDKAIEDYYNVTEQAKELTSQKNGIAKFIKSLVKDDEKYVREENGYKLTVQTTERETKDYSNLEQDLTLAKSKIVDLIQQGKTDELLQQIDVLMDIQPEMKTTSTQTIRVSKIKEEPAEPAEPAD